MPQQQRMASRLVSLSGSWGEETGGHVELSNVLTCPSPPSPLDILCNAQQEGNQERMESKNVIYAILQLLLSVMLFLLTA